MSLFSLIAALLIEQVRPLADRRLILAPLDRFADFLEGHLNAGEYRHGLFAWAILAVLLAGGSWLVFFLLCKVSPLLGWAWNVAVLYLTMGFRQFSHYVTDIQLALRLGDLPRARELLTAWRGRSAESFSSDEIARVTIEEGLAAAYRHVFAVVLWFVLLPGPMGAVLYRLAAHLADRWGRRADLAAGSRLGESSPGVDGSVAVAALEFGRFGEFAQQSFAIIDWLPARVTAFIFAIVGNFEDAAYCWRTQAAAWGQGQLGIVLAAGAGALGIRLGQPLTEGGELIDRAELGVGDDADVDSLQSAVGLVWRALVLWLFLLLLLGLASWVG